MKYILWITLILFLCSCDGFLRPISYDSPFPKKNYDLTKILGNDFTIIGDNDTLITYYITCNGDKNIIQDSNLDTFFIGKVCKYRGLYYFNEQYDDTTFWIWAVRISDSLIYGLNSSEYQMGNIYNLVRNGEYLGLVKYFNYDSTTVKLKPVKSKLREYSKYILKDVTPDIIILKNIKSPSINSESKLFEKEEYEFYSKVYPNPTNGKLFVNLQDKGNTLYTLADNNGKVLLSGQFFEKENNIDLSVLPNGIYHLTISDYSGIQRETINVIKTE
jgi:hypothetical protein